MTSVKTEKYKRAQEKVRKIRGFHSHFIAFIIVNIIIFIIKTNIYRVLSNTLDTVDFNFGSWLNWNFGITVILWALVLLIHGLYVHDFKLKIIKEWEERKIRQIIEKENKNNPNRI